MPVTLGLVGSVAAPVVGGLLGDIFGSGEQSQATEAQKAALLAMQGVNVPSIADQQVALQNYQLAGQIDPALQASVTQSPSAYGGISVDPSYMGAAQGALSQLGQLANGGLTATDLNNLMQIRNQSMGQANAQNQSVMANMAARGMAGGGAQLAAELSNSQNMDNMAAQNAMSVGSQAQQARLGALSNYATLGSSLNAQSYGQQAQAATAQNAINQFNSNLRYNTGAANTAALNQAKYTNLQNQQNVMNANTGVQNQQQMYNKGLYQQQFNDQMQKAYGVAGQNQNMSNYMNGQANATRGIGAGLGQAVGQGMAAYGAQAQHRTDMDTMFGSGSGSSGSSSGGTGGYGLGVNTSLNGVQSPNLGFSHGGMVPGEATVEGDSPENDTVHAKLSPGEIEIPVSFAKSPELAKAYVEHILKQKKG